MNLPELYFYRKKIYYLKIARQLLILAIGIVCGGVIAEYKNSMTVNIILGIIAVACFLWLMETMIPKKPRGFLCPHCKKLIYFNELSFDCPDCTNNYFMFNSERLFTGCHTCGYKVQNMECPNCKEVIDFNSEFEKRMMYESS